MQRSRLKNALRTFALTAPLAWLSACGTDAAAPSTGEAREAIQGGVVDSTDTGVVVLVDLSGRSLEVCSGTLITPNVVLTARHCVSDLPKEELDCNWTKFTSDRAASTMNISTNSRLRGTRTFHKVQEVRTAPGNNDLCGYDIALLILSDVISADEATPYIPRIDSPPVAGEAYDAMGFGITCVAASRPADAGACSQAGTRRRRNDLLAKCTGDDCDSVDIATNEWSGSSAVCSGDSGGPAIDKQGRVIGVASRAGADRIGNCVGAYYERVDTWSDFLRQAAVDGAKLGGYLAPHWARTGDSDPDAASSTADLDADAATDADDDASDAQDAANENDATVSSSVSTVGAGQASGGCALSPIGNEARSLPWWFAVICGLAWSLWNRRRITD